MLEQVGEALTVDNEYVSLKMENGVLYGKYLVNALNMDVINNIMHLQHSTFGKNIPFILVDISNVKSVTKDVREYFSKSEVTSNVTAAAFIAPSAFHKVLLNFFLYFNKPKVNMAFFTSNEDALSWLNKFR